MESIDDLLAQIKAEYQEAKPTLPPLKKSLLDEAEFTAPTSPCPTYQPQPSSQTWLSPVEESLLSDLKAELAEKEGINQPPLKKSLLDEAEFTAPTSPSPTYQPQPSCQTWLSPVEEGLLSDLKHEFAEKEKLEKLKKQEELREAQLKQEQQLREAQLRKEQREQKRREALTQEAQAWLKKIDPKSEEGLWFEEFSYSYPSKLEAAIDYLQALRETSL